MFSRKPPAAKSPEVVDGMIDDSLLGILIILFVVMLSTGYVYIQQLQQANGQPQGTQQLPGRRAPTAAAVQTAVSKRATVSTAGLTERQLRLHYSLPLRNGARTVTICTEALLTNENSATLAWKSEDVPSLLADLARVADVYLLCTVADAKDAASMQRIRDFVATNPDLKSSDATNAGVKAHKILFCTTTIGKVAFVRQIEPHVHVEGSGLVHGVVLKGRQPLDCNADYLLLLC
ncbi:hypothetical protein BBJ28_00002146 [Nothophytophthora sp. Chile5]|nr:hypothetical protein BBJ28_00002146 [Nothophytophthora sp. Chile5]